MKKDIKYIIKRVISAVLIILIVGNLKHCKVSADNLQNAYINNFGYNVEDITSTSWQQNAPIVDSFNISNYKLNIVNNSNNYFYYALFQDNSNNFYMFTSNSFNLGNTFSFNNINFTTSAIEYRTNDTISFSSDSGVFFSIRCFSSNNFSYSSVITDFVNDYNMTLKYNQLYDNNIYQNIYYFGSNSNTSSNMTSVLNYLNNNLTLVSSSVPFYINNNQIELGIPGFTKISLSGTQAVYFVPKDYSNIQIESIQTNPGSDFPLYTNYIDFNYYFKGSIKDGYFPLQNLDDITFKNIQFSPEISLVDSYFPMYEGGNDMSGYQFYSYIIFNNPDDNIDTIIYYNSILFDYYIIDDFYTYNEKICTIDRNNENICFNVDFGSSVSNAWLKGFNDENADFANNTTTEDKFSSVFDPIKIPFNWLKSLTNSTCSSLSLPIPFVNSSITLTCLSPRFKQVLGDSFYNIIFYIITGLYAYRITLMNIDTITDVLDPQDDKLEVIEL